MGDREKRPITDDVARQIRGALSGWKEAAQSRGVPAREIVRIAMQAQREPTPNLIISSLNSYSRNTLRSWDPSPEGVIYYDRVWPVVEKFGTIIAQDSPKSKPS